MTLNYAKIRPLGNKIQTPNPQDPRPWREQYSMEQRHILLSSSKCVEDVPEVIWRSSNAKTPGCLHHNSLVPRKRERHLKIWGRQQADPQKGVWFWRLMYESKSNFKTDRPPKHPPPEKNTPVLHLSQEHPLSKLGGHVHSMWWT